MVEVSCTLALQSAWWRAVAVVAAVAAVAESSQHLAWRSSELPVELEGVGRLLG